MSARTHVEATLPHRGTPTFGDERCGRVLSPKVAMISLPNRLPDPDTIEPEERLFVHRERPQWGVGLWVKEERTRRRMRFEDGKMRAFKKGYYHLLRPIDPDRDDLDDVFEALADEHQQVIAERAVQEAREARPPVMTFAEQVAVFHAQYEGGFRGDDYLDAARHRDSGALCKRHVDEELSLAQDHLSKPVLQQAIAEERFSDIVHACTGILERTTLVKPSGGHKLLAGLSVERHETFALSLYWLLHGQQRFRKRFGQWVDALRSCLGAEPSWPLATVFPALLSPDEHVCVKRRAFQLQALEIKPGTHLTKRVNKRSYRRARRVARATRAALVETGLQPTDLLDVRRFMWDTLRPKGQKLLEQLEAQSAA